MHFFLFVLEPASCGSADKKANTTIAGNDKKVGAVIDYKCPKDYVIVGDKNRTCTREGFWSGQAPSCHCKFSSIR